MTEGEESYTGPELVFEHRTEYGSVGRNIHVRTNFYRMTTLPESSIIHYDITITPDVPPAINRRVYHEFETLHEHTTLAGTKPVFDGRNNLFSPRPLSLMNVDAGTYQITLPEDDTVTTRRLPPRTFTIKIRKVGVINMDELIGYTERRHARIPKGAETALMALNEVFRHEPAMKYVTVGRSFYPPNEKQALFGGLEVWRGFYQAVKAGQNHIFVNVDISATAFYKSCGMVQLVTEILGRRNPDELRRGITDRDHQKIERALKGLKVRVNHRPSAARRKYRIKGITPASAERTTFNGPQGQTSVAAYFASIYQRLNFPYLPCIIVRDDNYIPFEVCNVVESQRYPRKLNDRQTADMIKFTTLQPHIRANKINGGLNLLNYRDNEYLRQFGIRVSDQMEVVPARVLGPPTIQYHASSRQPNFEPKDGVWNLRDKRVATGSTLGSWSVVAFGSESEFPENAIKGFIRELVVTCQNTGMKIPNSNPPIMNANPTGDIEGALKQAWLRAGNHAKAQPQLILCILPNTGLDLYREIKRVSDTVIGVVTQCIQGRHTSQPKRQYCANVCLKINVKLGGMNAFLEPASIPFITDVPTILIGADVTHPEPGSTNKPSIAALCASMDAKASRYAASIRVQKGRTDIIADLASMIKELLKTFYQTCGRKPDRILFYRDGISEGQFKKVLRDEIQAIKGACQALQADYQPKITFVVVQKRHHTRFFAMDKRDSDHTGNCLPGTVVEREITSPVEFDFYLQSQAGLQGTSRPTHYRVLYNENGLRPDEMQTLSYYLCYLYARCTRSVSLVPPVYYAHLVCNRARFHSRAHWSDTESSGSSEGGASTFSVVKPELQKVMYFM